MLRILRFTALGVALSIGCGVSAKANTMQFLVTAAQIEAAFTSSTDSPCSAGLTDCAIFGFAFKQDTIGGSTINSYYDPAPGSSAGNWSPTPIGPRAGLADTANDGKVEFITANSGVTGKSFSNLLGGTQTGLAPFSAGTQLGVNLDFGTTVAAGTADTITLVVLVDHLLASGAETGSKYDAVSLSYTAVATATPEPSSIVLLFGGLGAIVLRRRARR